MATPRSPKFVVQYDGVDISEDISKHVLSITYTDKVEGESDELEITLEDSDGRWRSDWYPEKGSKISVQIGYADSELVDCGSFEIDDIELSGPPDVVSIRALAAGIKGKLRTKRSSAHEKKTLKQIAEAIASKNGLSVTGEIDDITIDRVTQHRETDLGFLKRISAEYGHVFSVRDKQLVFTTIFKLEEGEAKATVDRQDISRYSLRDKTDETYKDAEVKYHNPVEKKVVDTKYNVETKTNAEGVTYKEISKGDTLVINTKAENKQQADKKAKAALHKANSRTCEGSLSMEGNPILLAGNNFTLTGMGAFSGKFHIEKSTHRIDRGSGYITELDIKRIGAVSAEKKKAKPIKSVPFFV